jgi:uncharacterized protein (TIGR00730 family)
MKRICVFCGSSPGFDACYVDMAKQLGRAIVAKKCGLVYGGSGIGLMGSIADTVMEAGGEVIGVIPESFAGRVSHRRLTKLHIADSMHERKTMMFNLSDAFIALPGGLGTLEEVLEVLTWAQLGFHRKPCGLINVGGYFDSLLKFLDNAVSRGFIKREHLDMLLVSDDPEDMLGTMGAYRAPEVGKWPDSV